MAPTEKTASTFTFAFGTALDDDSVYVAGTADELEDRDVHHTIIWERLGGDWKRYQWKNRSYGIAGYALEGAGTSVYMGYEGTVKVRSAIRGSSEEVVESGNDGPSSLRTISSIRVVGDHIYVSGMRRMVYRRPLNGAIWSRFDAGVRLGRADLAIAGLYSIDGHDPLHLHAVGIHGEIWQYVQSTWFRVDSLTNLALMAVRCLPSGVVVAGGEKGALLVGDRGRWTTVTHSFVDETFRCIEWWKDRCFIGSDNGVLYELLLGDSPRLNPLAVDGMPRVSWIAATKQRAWFFGGNSALSLGDDGWRDESPPAALLA